MVTPPPSSSSASALASSLPSRDGEPDEQEENASKRRKKKNHEEAEATTAAAAEAAAGNKGNADEAQHIRQVFGFTGSAVKQQQQQGGGFSFGFEAAKDQEVQQKLELIMAVDDGTTPPSTYVPCRVSRAKEYNDQNIRISWEKGGLVAS